MADNITDANATVESAVPEVFQGTNPTIDKGGLSPLQLALMNAFNNGSTPPLGVSPAFLQELKRFADSGIVHVNTVLPDFPGIALLCLGEDLYVIRHATDCGPDGTARTEVVKIDRTVSMVKGTFAYYGRSIPSGTLCDGTFVENTAAHEEGYSPFSGFLNFFLRKEPEVPVGNYDVLGAGPSPAPAEGAFDSDVYADANPTIDQAVTGYSGVYNGSLSAQGNMVAMQLSTGGYKTVPITYASSRWSFLIISAIKNIGAGSIYDDTVQYIKGADGVNYPVAEIKPFLTGYLRQYWKDPTKTTFGADSAIPALTGVVPAAFTGMQGSLLYYIDAQLTRVTGSNYFDIFAFLNKFNKALAWVTTSNNYIASLKNASETNLSYYGATDYKSFISQGFDTYKQSKALVAAIRNQGLMTETINSGFFGTPNAVVRTLITNGLGYINNLSSTIAANGINVDDMYSTAYTALCVELLQGITNAADLETIQGVMESSIPNMVSPYDYCSIEASSGLPNDSIFKTMGDFGADIFVKAPNIIVKDGGALATLLNNVQTTTGSSVENLAQQNSLLPQGVIDALTNNLPTNGKNSPVSILNVIGLPSGYLTGQLKKVNDGLAALYGSSYGHSIRSILTDISRYAAKQPLNYAEDVAAHKYQPVPPKITHDEYDEQTGEYKTIVDFEGGPDYYQVQLDQKIQDYYNLLNQIANDSNENIQSIVSTINNNYNELCQTLSLEYTNYNKANTTSGTYTDNSQLYSFVLSMPFYAADIQNLGTDTMIYGMAQNNSSGDLVKAIMGQAKNNQILGEVGVRIKGQI